MRVEHDGEYALVASLGGAPQHPVWYYNLKAHPDEVFIQDGPQPFDARVREVSREERDKWWARAVAAYPPYAEYQQRTDRQIPVFVAGTLPSSTAGPIPEGSSRFVARRVLRLTVRRSGSTVKGLSASPEPPSLPRRSRFDDPA
jgi:deazaflavin-dependent oxidoreductase (nitroreductase family)